ncbi:hypothetical protein [Enterococcus faecalis]|uniref:hypothetical protein n=1 Tax=Enterococcus faecalis TaxID=1351 RepID=UPI0009AC8BC2|nr:hypothetical protein [Enterococcus faecalis]MDT2145077.1 hypothetical protein [Enterococcus faecalis]MDV7871212.1 hypothetical protein [Enterococcus faecalis]
MCSCCLKQINIIFNSLFYFCEKGTSFVKVKKIKQRVLTKKTKRNMLHVQVKYKAMTEKQ